MRETSREVFISHTPYHILLSFSIASERDSDKQELIVIPANQGSKRLGNNLTSYQEIFTNINILESDIDASTKLERASIKRENIKNISSLIEDTDTIFVTNTSIVEDLAAVKLSSKDTNKMCIEDGAMMYNNTIKNNMNPISKLIRRLYFGSWYENTNGYGNLSEIDAIYCLFPNITRTEVKNKERIKINSSPLKNSRIIETVPEINSGISECKRILISLTHSEYFDEGMEKYISIIKKLISRALDDGLVVDLKYHPSEDMEYLEINNKTNVNSLPNHIPSELYILKNDYDSIYGFTSTAVYTAQWLTESDNVYNLIPLVDSSQNQLMSKLDTIGVNTVSNCRDL